MTLQRIPPPSDPEVARLIEAIRGTDRPMIIEADYSGVEIAIARRLLRYHEGDDVPRRPDRGPQTRGP